MSKGRTETAASQGEGLQHEPSKMELADEELTNVCGGVRRQSGRLYYRDSEPAMQGHGAVVGRGISSLPGASES